MKNLKWIGSILLISFVLLTGCSNEEEEKTNMLVEIEENEKEEVVEIPKEINVYDLGLYDAYPSDDYVFLTKDVDDTTVEGTDYKKIIKIKGINTAEKRLTINPASNYELFTGFIYNQESELDIEFRIKIDEDIIDTVVVEAGEKYDFTYDVKDADFVEIEASATVVKMTLDLEAIIFGELN